MKKFISSLQVNSVSCAADFWTVLLFFFVGVLFGTYASGHLSNLFASVGDVGKIPAGGLPSFLFENLKFQITAFLFAFFLFGFLLLPCLSFLFAYVYSYAFCTCFLSAAAFSSYAVYLLLFFLSVPLTIFLFADCLRISLRYYCAAIRRIGDARPDGRELLRPAVLFSLLLLLDAATYFILSFH